MWYSVRLLYEFVVHDASRKEDVLFEEKLVVLRVKRTDDLDAKLAAIAYGEENEYINANGDKVNYTFREVLEVQEVMDRRMTDGTEVFFRFWDSPGVRAFKTMRETHMDPWWPRHPEKPEPPPS